MSSINQNYVEALAQIANEKSPEELLAVLFASVKTIAGMMENPDAFTRLLINGLIFSLAQEVPNDKPN